MLNFYIKDMKVKERKIVDIQFDWSIADRPIIDNLNLDYPDLAVMLASRASGLESVFMQWALAGAIEQVEHIKVPLRGQFIRMVHAEIQRVAWSCNYFVEVFSELGEVVDKEVFCLGLDRTLGLQEQLSGARVLPQPIKIGGVHRDLSRGDFEKIKKLCMELTPLLIDGFRVLESNAAAMESLEYGLLFGEEWVDKFSLSGPIAQSVGLLRDLRYQSMDSPYQQLGVFNENQWVPGLNQGRTLDRYFSFKSQLIQSLSLLQKLFEFMPEGEFRSSVNQFSNLKSGESYFSVQGASGVISCKIINNLVSFETNSTRILKSLPGILFGLPVDELDLSIKSLGVEFDQGVFC